MLFRIYVLVRAFDDTTVEEVGATFKVPSDVDSTGTVTFRWVWYSTGQTTGTVVWFAQEYDFVEGDDWDASPNSISAYPGDSVDTGSTEDITVTTVTETVTNLAWAANDVVNFSTGRDADGSIAPTDDDLLSGDAQLLFFSVEIPRD